jgi:hypothetical protein
MSPRSSIYVERNINRRGPSSAERGARGSAPAYQLSDGFGESPLSALGRTHGPARRRLSMAVLESLAQRIVVRHHVTGLTREELPDYLTHRLRLAGSARPLRDSAQNDRVTHCGRPSWRRQCIWNASRRRAG